MTPSDLTASVQDLQQIADMLQDISEDDLLSNFSDMSTKSKRKMTFQLAGKNYSAKAVTVRFTPEWQPPSKGIRPENVKQTANDEITRAFKGGQVVLEVVNQDDTRTAFASKETAQRIRDKDLLLTKNGGTPVQYSAVKTVESPHFESIAQSLLSTATSENPQAAKLTADAITENAALKDVKTQLPPAQVQVKLPKKEVTVTTAKAPNDSSPESEEAKLLKEEEKELEAERDAARTAQAVQDEKQRIETKIEEQERQEEIIKTDTEMDKHDA